MAHKLQDSLSLQARRGCRVTATAFALAMAGAWQPAVVPAQDVDVEVITTGTQEQTTASLAQPGGLSATVNPEDLKADEAANKIVPAPGTHLQSTAESSLGATGSVAPAPSVTLKEDQLVLQEGQTTETVAVKSGAELLRMLGIQSKSSKTATAGGELDEETSVTLFDVTAVERLKGAKPTVVYRVVVENSPLPDPMIVPWIRQAKLLQERFDKAVVMLGENQVERGRQELLSIATDFPDSDYAIQSRELLKKLDDIKTQIVQAPVAKEADVPVVELSPNIQVGTVIVDSADPTGNRVMINGRIYRSGEEIRGVPGHKVTGISEAVVQIEVEQSGQKQTFDVPVRPTGAN